MSLEGTSRRKERTRDERGGQVEPASVEHHPLLVEDAVHTDDL
jgi:hypothetical protein